MSAPTWSTSWPPGHEVKALLRPGADERGLAGAAFQRVTGDVLAVPVLEQAMRGCDWCFHVAASYHLWLRDYRPMYEANVEGTRQVLTAAGRAGSSLPGSPNAGRQSRAARHRAGR